MNWYLVRDGKIVTRYGDAPPVTYIDPTDGLQHELDRGLSPAALAAQGWLMGIATDPLAYDSETQKSYILPQVPDGLQQYIDGWQVALKAGKPMQVPSIVEQWVVEDLSDDELAQIQNMKLRDLRSARDYELMRTDRLMLADSPVVADPKQFDAWKTYRQTLRDLPDTVDEAEQVAWPVAPDGTGPGAAVAAGQVNAVPMARKPTRRRK